MNQQMRDALVESFEYIVNTMGTMIEDDRARYGEDVAVDRFQKRVEAHHRDNGTWDKMSDAERPAGMIWAAAELLIGAMFNAGVFRDE